MYPNPTNKLTQSNIFTETFSISNTFLTYKNWGSKYSESVEIGMPYMILYESINRSNNQALYSEFTETNQNIINNSYEYMLSYSPRPLHYHNFYELTIVLSGELTLQIENECRTYHPGDCCICNKNIRHKEIAEMENANYEIVLFMLTEEYLKSLLEGDLVYDTSGNHTARNTFFYKLFKDNAKNHFFDAKEYIEFRINHDFDSNDYFKLLNDMILTIRSSRAGKSYQMKAFFCQFIEMLEDKNRFDININWAKLSNEDVILYKVGNILQDNPVNFNNAFLEQELGYNADYINRIIKRRTGVTLSEFCRNYLLELAAVRLENTSDKITDICNDLGYSNRSFFNKLFLDKYGLTPSEYRKRH